MAAAALAVACDPKPVGPEYVPTFEVSGASLKDGKLEIAAAGANATFTVNSNLSWTITSSEAWATVTPSEFEGDGLEAVPTEIKVAVAANTSYDPRTATLTIAAADFPEVKLTVSQSAANKPAPVLEILQSDMTSALTTVSLGAKAEDAYAYVFSNVSFTVSSDAEWCAVSPSTVTVENYEETPSTITISAAANTASDSRSATVTFTPAEGTPVTVAVSQEAALTIGLSIKEVTHTTATIKTEISDQNAHYFLMLETPAYVNKFSTDEELMAAELEYWYEEYGDAYAEAGFTSYKELLLEGVCDQGSGEFTFKERQPETDYVCYAFAIDDETLEPISDLFRLNVKTEPKPAANAKYEDYLGQWVMGNMMITVAQKVAGQSYSISGLLYQEYPTFGYEFAPVEATFDKGYFILSEQITGVEVSVGSYGACDVVLTGEFTSGGKQYKYYPFNGSEPLPLFNGVFDGNNTITIEAQSCPYGAFSGMAFAWVIKSGANAGKGNYFTTMPFSNMTKYEAPTGPTPEGQWYCPSVTDYWGEATSKDWTMTIEPSGVGFKINNFDQGFDEFLETQVKGLRCTAPVGVWNSKENTLTISAGTQTGISAGANLYWTGLAGNTTVDIVLKFDFEKNTCAYTTPLWGAYLPDATDPGFYTLYNGPDMVFTKVTTKASTKAANCVEIGGQIPYNKSFVKHTAFDKAILNTAKTARIANDVVAPKTVQSAKNARR